MFESKALTRLNEALDAVVDLGPTLREMVEEIRSMREVMVETNRALGEVTTAMDETRAQLVAMSDDVTRASEVIDNAHKSLATAAERQGLG